MWSDWWRPNLVDHFLPEFGEGSRTLIVGEVDRHVFAVVGGGERTASGKPDHRVVEAGVTRIGCDVHADAFQLFGRLVIVVPRANLGGIDATCSNTLSL